MSQLRPGDFEFISQLLKQHMGLALTTDKEYLLENRLMPIARARNIETLSGVIDALRKPGSDNLRAEVVEAMTTNESLFFRDGKPFEQLKAVLLPLLRQQAETRKAIRIWSAACSTGQEPYSVCITLLEEPNSPSGWKYELMATDIAQKVLDKAEKAIYTQFEAQRGMPIQMLIKYFQPQPDTSWQLKDNVRSMVSFRQANLLQDFSSLGMFDLIMCRNVLIYFDDPTKTDICARFARSLHPKGVLMLGSTESLIDPAKNYEPMADLRGVYQKRG